MGKGKAERYPDRKITSSRLSLRASEGAGTRWDELRQEAEEISWVDQAGLGRPSKGIWSSTKGNKEPSEQGDQCNQMSP